MPIPHRLVCESPCTSPGCVWDPGRAIFHVATILTCIILNTYPVQALCSAKGTVAESHHLLPLPQSLWKDSMFPVLSANCSRGITRSNSSPGPLPLPRTSTKGPPSPPAQPLPLCPRESLSPCRAAGTCHKAASLVLPAPSAHTGALSLHVSSSGAQRPGPLFIPYCHLGQAGAPTAHRSFCKQLWLIFPGVLSSGIGLGIYILSLSFHLGLRSFKSIFLEAGLFSPGEDNGLCSWSVSSVQTDQEVQPPRHVPYVLLSSLNIWPRYLGWRRKVIPMILWSWERKYSRPLTPPDPACPPWLSSDG